MLMSKEKKKIELKNEDLKKVRGGNPISLDHFKCPKCNKKFNTYEELTQHELTHLLSCRFCNTQFNTIQEVILHEYNCPENKEEKGNFYSAFK